MYPSKQYANYSLELHLFFARIMKEHSLFLMAGFTPANTSFTKAAEDYKCAFEKLLCEVVILSNGLVRQEVLVSGEIITPFTAVAEQQTELFTGICINKDITTHEKLLCSETRYTNNCELNRKVQVLNQEALRLLDGLISLKEQILCHVLNCRMFTMNYPLLLEHIIREAKLYRDYVHCLEMNGNLDPQTMGQVEQFWNQIMMEHAMFIRGLLDPSENELIDSADTFSKDYACLLAQSCAAQDAVLTRSTLEETQKFRDFKKAGVEGIEECKIRSVILPLLADHVLREANHYIRLLNHL